MSYDERQRLKQLVSEATRRKLGLKTGARWWKTVSEMAPEEAERYRARKRRTKNAERERARAELAARRSSPAEAA